MNKVRTQKTVVVDEVKTRIDATSTAVVTEYRGLTVAEISSLRRSLRTVDAEYKVLKNTLVRRAVEGTQSEGLTPYLVGPTAIAWVKGDISAVAKILRDFAKTAPALKLKGGVLDGKALTAKDLTSLADLPSRDILLSQLAGLLASPMSQMAGLLKAIPQSFAYGLKALIEQKGGAVIESKSDVADTDDAVSAPADQAESANGEVTDEATAVEAEVAEAAPEAAADVAAPEAEVAEAAPETEPVVEDAANSDAAGE
jgi:large subunit ribosomal protein L10